MHTNMISRRGVAPWHSAVAQSETFSNRKEPETKLLSAIEGSFTLFIWGAFSSSWTTFSCPASGFLSLSPLFKKRKKERKKIDDARCGF